MSVEVAGAFLGAHLAKQRGNAFILFVSGIRDLTFHEERDSCSLQYEPI